jgi:hypothetical protein
VNERIDELMIEAGARFEFLHGVHYDDFQYRKFAELIVKECIDKIQNYDLVPGHSAKWEDIYDIHARLLDDLGEELKQHFGVEE